MARKTQHRSEAPMILRRRQVEERTGLSRSTIYQRIRLREFPLPINLGGRAVGWLDADIDQWIERQIQRTRDQRDLPDWKR